MTPQRNAAWLQRNPEFVRNVWLEITPQRLLIMPALIVLVLVGVALAYWQASHEPGEIIHALGLASALGFMAVTVSWGSNLASASLTDELTQGTWDSQRMSALGPWQMTWGKLFGGAIYAWYCGGILLLTLCACLLLSPRPRSWLVVALVAPASLAIATQSLSLMQTLLSWRRYASQRSGAWKPRSLGLVGTLLLLWLGATYFISFAARSEAPSPTVWMGANFHPLFFATLSLAFFAAWTLIGLWQVMRTELQLRNKPWWFLAFMLFWTLWLGGFQYRDLPSRLLACCVFLWASVYLLLFHERKDAMHWRHIAAAWRDPDRSRLAHLMPRWSLCLGLALLTTVATCAVILLQGGDMRAIFLALGIAALVMRDVAWILFLHLGSRRASQADGAVMLSLFLAWLVVPLLLSLSSKNAVYFFYPFSAFSKDGSSIVHVAAQWMQMAVAAGFLAARWRRVVGGCGVRNPVG